MDTNNIKSEILRLEINKLSGPLDLTEITERCEILERLKKVVTS